MREKYISDISLAVNAILFLVFGIFALIAPINSTKIFHILSYVALITISFVSFVLLIFKHQRNRKRLVSIILYFITGIIIYYNPTYYLSLFPFVFGLYLFMIGIFKIVFFIYKTIQKTSNDLLLLIGSVINFILGYFLVINPYKSLKLVVTIFGIYLILNGLDYLHDFLRINYPGIFKRKTNYYTAKIPIITMSKPINEYKKLSTKLNHNITKIALKEENTKPDIEILIHVKSRYPGNYGHADIIIDDKVYSYGNYDDKSKRVWEAFGDGVIFETSKDEYIEFCTRYSKKMMFCFGLKLGDKKKQLVQEKLNKILANTYRWYPDVQKDPDNKEKYQDYASTLANNLKIKFYKFYRSSYRIYFIFYANCVKLVDDILGSSGLDLLKLDGLVVPGTYYDFLDKEFRLKNSNVISKNIYVYKERKKK